MSIRAHIATCPENSAEQLKPSKQRRISCDSNLGNAKNILYPPRKNSIWQRMKKTVSESFSSPVAAQPTIRRAFSSGSDIDNNADRCKTNEDINFEVVSSLAARKTAPNPKRLRRIISTVNSESILHFAVTENDASLVNNILKTSDVDVNAKRPPGITPLHQACMSGNVDCARVLVLNGAKVNMKDWQGRSALKLAVCAGNFELAEFLIQNGAVVDDIRDGFQADESRPRSRSHITIRTGR